MEGGAGALQDQSVTGWTKGSVYETSYHQSKKKKKESVTEHILQHAVCSELDVSPGTGRVRQIPETVTVKHSHTDSFSSLMIVL